MAAPTPPDAPSHCVVWTTVGSEEHADQLARRVVEARLAACAQVQAIKSHYRWQGQLCADSEWLILMKTRSDAYPRLEALLRQHHPYTTPEIIATTIVAGWPDYLAWVDDAVDSAADGPPDTPAAGPAPGG